MKKKIVMTLVALGVFFIASCEDSQNLLNEPPRDLEFIPEILKEGAAVKGVQAGSFSAEGGTPPLAYSLISVAGEHNDNDQFTLTGSLLTINVPELEGKEYCLYVQVEDAKGQFLEGSFTLAVSPPDGTEEPGDEGIAGIIESWRGVWYSVYGGARLDGYRVGRWSEIKEVMGDKLALFPDFDPDKPLLHDKRLVQDNDYFFFYDDTVYGEDGNGQGGNGGWGLVARYIGIARAVNTFNGDSDEGAVIIEYLEGCYPQWAMDVVFWPLPFFGIYYRVIGPNTMQLANAVDLDALSAGKAYYTETATLQEAIDKNNAENSGKFISWGVVIPQTRN
jgi:hypothetical protein